MYVTGRGTGEYGAILPAITEWKRSGRPLCKVLLEGTNRKHSLEALQKVKTLQTITGFQYDIEVFPNKDGIDDKAYLEALSSLNKPDCAFVAVPDHLHCEVATVCIKRGLHTLVVKPLTPNSERGQSTG